MRAYYLLLGISFLISSSWADIWNLGKKLLLPLRSVRFYNFRIYQHNTGNDIQGKPLYSLWSSARTIPERGTNRRALATVPPLLLFLLSTAECSASPLNPQRVLVNSPFFQGWLVRGVDHKQSLSFIFIVGSFSTSGSSSYDEHYVFCGISSPNFHRQVESFPPKHCVSILGNLPSTPHSPDKPLNITWEASGYGNFKFSENCCKARYSFKPEGVNIDFNMCDRMPWRPGKQGNYLDGPEGWLGYTTLLPCHYFVHSVGSKCSYTIEHGKSQHRVQLSGTAAAHIEGNHGGFFPEGWIWSQGIAPGNDASFSLVAGKFVIGGIAPTNCVFFLRRRNGNRCILRTTDMDQVHYHINALEGTVSMNFTSFLKQERVELTIRAMEPPSAKGVAFGDPVHVPTSHGFSNCPGCIETYTAVAIVRLFPGGAEQVPVGEAVSLNSESDIASDNLLASNLKEPIFAGATAHRYVAGAEEEEEKEEEVVEYEEYYFPLSALEFGGSFIGRLIT